MPTINYMSTELNQREQFERYLMQKTQELSQCIEEKYERGKREHQQSILDINVLQEMEEELIDLFVYFQLLKFKMKQL